MSNDIHPGLHAALSERTRHLLAVAQALKTELFGIDDIIDRLPADRIDDVAVLDPADADRPVGYNPLAAVPSLAL